MRFRELALRRDANCPVCGENPSIRELIDYQAFCGLKSGADPIPVEQVTVTGLKELFASEPGLQIVDIREPHELAMGKLPNTRAIPYGQLERRMEELNPSVTTVVVCKLGIRSEMAVRVLKKAGYRGRIVNLQDGINAWAEEIDPSFVVY
jgi:adenylyltransferase/sulfurtransferase